MHKLLNFVLLCFIALCAGVYVTHPHAEISIGAFTLHGAQDKPLYTTMRFVGDVMLARNVEYLMDTYGSGYPFSTLPVLDPGTYLIGNFESAIPKVHIPTKSMTFTFSTDPQNLQGAKDYGFTHFGLANNHAYDFGKDGYKHTHATLLENDFDVFGDSQDLSTSSVAVLEIKGSRVAIVGIHAVHEKPQLADVIDVFNYAKTVSAYQIAYVHWGEEYQAVHNKAQEKLAHDLVDAGADAVIGHHPHVIQDIELYKNALIFYSLGNFIFDQYFSDEVQLGLMVDFSIDESMLSVELLPVTSIGSRTVPRLALRHEKENVLAELAKKSDTELHKMITTGIIKLDI